MEQREVVAPRKWEVIAVDVDRIAYHLCEGFPTISESVVIGFFLTWLNSLNLLIKVWTIAS